MAEDVVLDVGIQITPDSIRSIQRDVKTAFNGISPQIDINESELARQLDTAIDKFSLAANIGRIKVSEGAVSQLQEFISRNVKVDFNNISASASAVARFKKQVEDQAKITLEAQANVARVRRGELDRPAGTFGGAGDLSGGADLDKIAAAVEKAELETLKLAEAEAALQIATRENAAVRVKAASAENAAFTENVRALKNAAAASNEFANGNKTAAQTLSKIRNIKFNDLNALGETARQTIQAEQKRLSTIIETNEKQETFAREVEQLGRDFRASQTQLNESTRRAAESRREQTRQNNARDVRALQSQFNERQRSLNASVERSAKEKRAQTTEEARQFTQNIRALKKIASASEDFSTGFISAKEALSQLKNVNFNDLNSLGQLAGVTLEAERKRLGSIVAADDANKDNAKQLEILKSDLLKLSPSLGRLSGSAKRAANRVLVGIKDVNTLADARKQLAAALLAGRKIANEELAQSALNSEVAKAKKKRLASEKEVERSNKEQARIMQRNLRKRAESDQQVRDFATGLGGGGDGGGSRGPSGGGSASIRLREQAAATNRAREAQKQLTNELNGGTTSIGKFSKSVVLSVKRLGLYAAASALVFGLIGALSSAKEEIIKLDDQSRRLVFFSEGNAFGESVSGLDSLAASTANAQRNMEGLLQASINTGLSLQQTTDILVTVARIGQQVDGAFSNAVTSLVRLEAGALDAGTAVTSLNAIQIQFLNTLTQYTDTAEEAAAVTDSISTVAAVLATTAAESAANVQQLSEATARVGAALGQIQGLDATTTIAILGEAFNATGASASRVGTTFRQLSTLIVKNADEIQRLSGIEVLSDTGQIKGFESILDVLERVNSLSGTSAGLELINQISDRRNLADVQSLATSIDTLRSKFGDFTSEAGRQRIIIDRVTKAYDANELQQKSLSSQIESLKSQFVSLAGGPIESFLISIISGMKNVISFTTGLIDRFKELTGEQDGLNGFKILFESLSPLLTIFNNGLAVTVLAIVKVADVAALAIGGIIKGLSEAITSIGEFIGLLDTAAQGRNASGKDGAANQEEEDRIARGLDRQSAARKAIQDQRAAAVAQAKKDVALQEREKRRLEEINGLRRDSAEFQKILNSETATTESKTFATIRLKEIEGKLDKLKVENLKSVKAQQRELLTLQTRFNIEKEKELQITKGIAEVEKFLLTSAVSKENEIEVKLRFNNESIEKEISTLEGRIEALTEQGKLATGTDQRVKISKEIAKIQADVDSRQSKLLANNLKIQESILKTTTAEIKKQASEYENAGSKVVNSFKEAISSQQEISSIFEAQGQLIQNIIKSSGENTARFLEATGASIEQRLANVADTANKQIAEIDRTQRRRRNLIGDAGNINQAVTQVISGLEQVSRRATTALFGDIRNLEQDVNAVRLRSALQASREELSIRIAAAKQDIAVRKNAINQEISIINEKIAAERRLNDLRIKQQRDFGRLLIESPKQFVQTVKDIKLAEQFFKGIRDLGAKSLQTIASRSLQLRASGQGAVLQSVLRGIQASDQFGGDQVAGGIDNAQLQSVFERLQLQSPAELTRSLEQQQREAAEQTKEQKRIKALQEEMQALDRESVSIQQAQIRLSSATAAVAARQRAQLNLNLSTLIATNATNFAQLIAAQASTRETALARAGGEDVLTKKQVETLNAQRQAESKVIETAAKTRLNAIRDASKLRTEQAELIKKTKDTSGSLSVFGDTVNGLVNGLNEQRNALANNGAGSPTIAGTTLDASSNGVFGEIGRSLRILGSGSLKIVSPELVELRKAVEKSGGTREQRNRLRELERQSRRTIGGSGADQQGRVAAGRFLRDEQTAARVETGFRTLLQDRSGGQETQFVQELRKLRGEGQRGAARVDAGALRRLLGAQGLGGVAEGVKTSRQGAGVIDRLLKLSDELSENQKSLSREAGKAIKKILSEEVAEGIRDLKSIVDEAKKGIKDTEDRKDAGQKALAEALKNFSIAAPEDIKLINSEVRKAFNDSLTEAGKNFAERMSASIRDTKLNLVLPQEGIGLEVSLDIANGITEAGFARQLAQQFKEAGFTDKALLDKIIKQLQVITAPLIAKGLISASPDFVQPINPTLPGN